MNMSKRRLLFAGVAAAAAAGLGRFFPRPAVAASQGSETFEITLTETQWRDRLSEREFAVLRQHDTEAPGSSPLLAEKREGIYTCAGCGQALFESRTKFDSGTGWPSFWAPIEGSIGTRTDRSLLLMVRTEVHCSRCGGHLGHVFEDGPPPTGLRYCLNGVALNFKPAAGAAA
jgi:peptide-methionine (R)-S-oxide reductase